MILTWDRMDADEIGIRLGDPVWIFGSVPSTQDIAHMLAEKGAPPGAVVLAETQEAGRGQLGRSWVSEPNQGVWCSVVVRPISRSTVELLSLRVGLNLAEALDQDAGEKVLVKWPNDLRVGSGKLAGVLTEVRWNGATPIWAAVGVGVNVIPPRAVANAAGLSSGTRRLDVLQAITGAIRRAAASEGPLTTDEVERFRDRDALAGKPIISPGVGVVQGIDASGALLVRGDTGVAAYRGGTVQLVSDA